MDIGADAPDNEHVQLNVAGREIALKIVYYGPPLSGKTSNIQALFRGLNPRLVGNLTTLNTVEDRTVFFDLLPVTLDDNAGYCVKLKLYTVPGQVVHAATRRLVLSGADGVVFVADSQLSESKANNEYWHGMRRYMRENGIDPATVPTVIQFNKRDLPNIRSDAELDVVRKNGPEPLFTAVAIQGEGVQETLRALLLAMFKNLETRYELASKLKVSSEAFMAAVFANGQARRDGGTR